jgi:hypothetical protein
MNSQPGKLSVLPGRVKTAGVTPVVYDEPLLRLARSSVVSRVNGRKPFALFCALMVPAFGGHAVSGFDPQK